MAIHRYTTRKTHAHTHQSGHPQHRTHTQHKTVPATMHLLWPRHARHPRCSMDQSPRTRTLPPHHHGISRKTPPKYHTPRRPRLHAMIAFLLFSTLNQAVYLNEIQPNHYVFTHTSHHNTSYPHFLRINQCQWEVHPPTNLKIIPTDVIDACFITRRPRFTRGYNLSLFARAPTYDYFLFTDIIEIQYNIHTHYLKSTVTLNDTYNGTA